jgi:hypothetical protein
MQATTTTDQRIADAIRTELAHLATGAHRTITDRWTRLEDWCASKADVQVTADNEITITHPTQGDAIIGYAIDGATQDDANGWIDPTDTPKVPGRTIYRPRG